MNNCPIITGDNFGHLIKVEDLLGVRSWALSYDPLTAVFLNVGDPVYRTCWTGSALNFSSTLTVYGFNDIKVCESISKINFQQNPSKHPRLPSTSVETEKLPWWPLNLKRWADMWKGTIVQRDLISLRRSQTELRKRPELAPSSTGSPSMVPRPAESAPPGTWQTCKFSGPPHIHWIRNCGSGT